MNKKNILKKISAVALAATMIVSAASSSFAANANDWTSFQLNGDNNAVVTSGSLPTSTGTTTKVNLPVNAASYSGIDAESIIGTNGGTEYIYSLYNAGAANGSAYGARMHATDKSGTQKWDIQLDANDTASSQLSTPILASDDNIYVGTTQYVNWFKNHVPSGDSLKTEMENDDTTNITLRQVQLPSDFRSLQINTGLVSPTGTGLSATVTFTSTGSGTSYSFGTNGYYGDEYILYDMDDVLIPAGTYDISIDVTNTTGSDLTTDIQLNLPVWKLSKITGIYTTTPTATEITAGYGQANSPIKQYGDYIYFGIYDGVRSYYQYDITASSAATGLTQFTPNGGNDFYWAGATEVTISDVKYVIFGSDQEYLYLVPEGDGFATARLSYNLKKNIASADKVRSTISQADGYIYFTSDDSKARPIQSHLWRIQISSLLNASGSPNLGFATIDGDSVSTPTIFNGVVYVGYYNQNGTNGVYAATINRYNYGFVSSATGSIYTVPTATYNYVQSSIVVNRINGTNYLYFVSGAGTGAGKCYCISHVPSSTSVVAANSVWTTDANYSVQGITAGNGFLVYGSSYDYSAKQLSLYIVQ
jgi:hypothetical protein